MTGMSLKVCVICVRRKFCFSNFVAPLINDRKMYNFIFTSFKVDFSITFRS